MIVLDGWGYRPEHEHNAIFEARTPFFDRLWQNYPHTLLNASEEFVGLPEGVIGNSEIGHMTMGSGRVIDTDLVRITKNMLNGGFDANPAFTALFEHVKKYDSVLHIAGLLSDGGVHSHSEHLYGFLRAAKRAGLKKITIHVFTDGRDVAPQKAAEYLRELEKIIGDLGVGFIASATGRYFAMDRDKNWDRTQKAEDAVFTGKGQVSEKNPSEAMAEFYKQGVVDELLEPTIFLDPGGRPDFVKDNDGIFFFNFRTDRPRQLARKIAERAKKQNLYFVTMTEYDPAIESSVAFPKALPQTTLAAEISAAGLKQSRIAETEKYAHVTYFFNGGRREPCQNEEQILIDSRRDIKTHDQAPEMRAREIADAALKRLDDGDDFILINFANADMVGHSANKPAIIQAVETVDRELKRVAEKVLALGGSAIITADHGNAEVNVHPETGERHTAHTLNLVPFILAGHAPGQKIPLKSKGSLADIAPTILRLLNLPKPETMTGESLIAL